MILFRRVLSLCSFLLALVLCASLFSLPLLLNKNGVSVSAEPNAEISDWTVVLDAGHGGEDGGAVSADGIFEKDVNLAIAKKLQVLLESAGIPVVMTRDTDVLLYDRNVDFKGRKKALDLAERRRIAEGTPDCLFISIHLNAFPLSQYSGLQVWYSPNDARSESAAETVRTLNRTLLQPENDRKSKAAGSSIYLLHHLKVPAILVECGFLSNPEEAGRLASEQGQNEVAFLLFLSILRMRETIPNDP